MCNVQTEIYVDTSKLCPGPKTSSIIIIGKTSMGMNERT